MGVMYLASPVFFMALARYPPIRRYFGPLGLLISVVSIAASAFVTSIGGLIALQGALYSLGCGLIFAPISLYMDEWFSVKKGFAYGVMWAGKSATGIAMPFVFDSLLKKFGLKATLISWAIATAVMLLPTLFFLRPRTPLEQAPRKQRLSFDFLRHTSFWMIQLSIIVQSLGYLMPTTYLASYAKSIGFSSITGPILLALFSVSSVPGGILHGILGDRISNTKVVLLSSVGSALPIFLLWGFSKHLANMVVFVICYGFFAGGFSSTWSSMMREIQRDSKGNTDTPLLFGLLMGGRGVGFVIGGPLSGLLISKGLSDENIGYATKYGPMILTTGITALLGAWGPLWKFSSRALCK